MTKIIKPNAEQWAVLQDLGLTAPGFVIAIIAPEQQEYLSTLYSPEDLTQLESQIVMNYDCGGGDPDLMVDVVASNGHYIFSWCSDAAEDLPNDTETPEEPHVSLQQSQDQAE
jgi:hypothetical protein